MRERIIRKFILDGGDLDTVERLMKQMPELTNAELRIAALLERGMTTHETAETLGTSERTIENHRYRMRKKLGLTSNTDLQSALSYKQ